MIIQKPDTPNKKARQKPLTIRSILIMTAVLASSAASFGQLYRAANGEGEEIGRFVITTAMMPLLMLVGAYWTLKIARHINR